jgi:hypothetical protein
MSTTFDMWSALAVLGLTLLALAGCWSAIPRIYGFPKGTLRHLQIRRAMELAEVQPGDTVYDLNAGDGRGLVIAARDFGARAAGVEVEPLHCAVAWLRALFGGVIARVSVHRGDLFRADLSDADVVFLYLTPALLARLRPRLEYELRPNTRIVSMLFPLEGWEPAGIDIGHLIFYYRTPLKPGSIDSYLRQSIAESP